MTDHVIVCGAGPTGSYVVDELVAARCRVIAIDEDPQLLRALEERHPGELLQCITGDPTNEAVLARAELATARGLVAAMTNDKDNIYLIVEARQVNPTTRIIATATARSHVDKLKRVGADAIVNPGYIGGLRMVSEMLRPDVVRFLDDMLRDTRAIWRIEEATVEQGSKLAGATLAEIKVRTNYGMTVLALGRPGGKPSAENSLSSSVVGHRGPWIYNPSGDEKLMPGTILVVLGDVEQVANLRLAGRAGSAGAGERAAR
jgi:voltage-gated potassium channel